MTGQTEHDASINALETRLAKTSRATQALDWAIASYRLGMARAEDANGSQQENLKNALSLYEDAASVLTEERAPIEHARVINAAGSAHRLLGNPQKAAELFERAANLLDGRDRNAERASVLSNLGLANADCGRANEAVTVFNAALALLSGDDDEQRRARVATRHNLAQSLMSTGNSDDLTTAIETLEAANSECADTDSPLHQAMVWHSLGVARKGRAEGDPARRDTLLDQAIEHFERCLTIFTAAAFPFHHAVAKQNLGLALAGRGDISSCRRALACYEEAVTMFDPRLHTKHWRATYKNMEALEAQLAVTAPGQTRHDHYATFLGEMDEVERLGALRGRLALLERLPPAQRLDRLVDLAYAVVQQPPRSFVATLRTMIMVLMELPDDVLHSALEAQLIAHNRLEPHDQRAADFILDEAINLLLFGPQRIRVRDLLSEIGWDRP